MFLYSLPYSANLKVIDMINDSEIRAAIPNAVQKTDFEILTKKGYKKTEGKVRDMYSNNKTDTLVMCTTDRISAFDRVIGAFPYKGAVLTYLAEYGFDSTLDLIPNHMISVVDPQIMVIERAHKTYPLEMVIRGYLTGSGWRAYTSQPYVLNKDATIKRDDKGAPVINRDKEWSSTNNAFYQGYGIEITGDIFEDGKIREGAKFKRPIVTPTTKSEKHDEPLTKPEAEDIVGKSTYNLLENSSLALYKRGAEIAENRGLIFVDTKYEFGETIDGEVIVIDEVNTPDSSRFWVANEYQKKLQEGKKQKGLDKEFTRQFLIEKGFQGDGETPNIPDSHIVESVKRYVDLYERVTGKQIESKIYIENPKTRMHENLESAILDGTIIV